MNNETIAKLKNLNVMTLKNECALDEWFSEMVRKTVDELNILDISRMLRQNVYADIALPIVWRIIKEDPFKGEMYEGQLLELLVRYLQNFPENLNNVDFDYFIDVVDNKILLHLWDDNVAKERYTKSVEEFKRLIVDTR